GRGLSGPAPLLVHRAEARGREVRRDDRVRILLELEPAVARRVLKATLVVAQGAERLQDEEPLVHAGEGAVGHGAARVVAQHREERLESEGPRVARVADERLIEALHGQL